MSKQKISIISPVYNEEEVIKEFLNELQKKLKTISRYDFEIILVNDGSTDKTNDKIKSYFGPIPVKLIDFVTNQGQQKAIIQGLSEATGNADIVMDADLQDLPEDIAHLLEKWEKGADAVMAARQKRKDNIKKKVAAKIYYRILRLIDRNTVVDSGDFYLLDKSLVTEIVNLPETGYLRGQIPSLAKRLEIIKVNRQARLAGKSSYSLGKMLRLAGDGFKYALKRK